MVEIPQIKGLNEEDYELFRHNMEIKKLGAQNFMSPLTANKKIYESQMIPEDERVLAFIDKSVVESIQEQGFKVPSSRRLAPERNSFSSLERRLRR